MLNKFSLEKEKVVQAIATFPLDVREDLFTIYHHGGMLEAQTVKNITQVMGIDIATLMVRLVPIAAAYATTPVSNYPVGAVVCAGGKTQQIPFSTNNNDDNNTPNLYLGANIEFAQQALASTIHAEQAAVNNAWANGETHIPAIAVSAPPCGHCRQFLYELNVDNCLNVLLPSPEKACAYTTTPLTQLLPKAFGPADLGVKGGLLGPNCHKLFLDSAADDPLVDRALQAAKRCYAPYSKNYAGCALRLQDGSIFSGCHAENAAYNPTLPPLNAAIAQMSVNLPVSVAAHNTTQSTTTLAIERAVLVERPTVISQRLATEQLLLSLAPQITLEYQVAE